MSFNPLKFKEFSPIQRRKKLSYYLHRSIIEHTSKYIKDIALSIEWINQYEFQQISTPQTQEELKSLYKKIHREIQENDPYQENILFDKPKEERTLLPKKIGVILDNIRSPFNVGSFFRTSEAFGIHELILLGITPSPENQVKVIKTTKGDLIPFRSFKDINTFLLSYKENLPTLLGIEKARGSTPLEKINLDRENDIYLIFGNEEFGLPYETLKHCQAIHHIPMLGAKNSLNVSVAGGITLQYLASLLGKKS